MSLTKNQGEGCRSVVPYRSRVVPGMIPLVRYVSFPRSPPLGGTGTTPERSRYSRG